MRNLFFLLLLCIILFISSSQTYEEQSLIGLLQKWLPHKPFENVLSHIFIPYWGHTISIEERGYYLFIEFIVRKSAHFVLFGFVGLFLFQLAKKLLSKKWAAAFVSLLFTCVLAVFDEYHQSLTGGRTPSFKDVVLDTVGAIAFIGIALLWHKEGVKDRKS